MRSKGFLGALVFSVVVLFAYTTVNAQVDKIKDAAGKTKDVTVDAAKKTADVTTDVAKKTKVVVTDGLAKAADKTADATVSTTKNSQRPTASPRTSDINASPSNKRRTPSIGRGNTCTVC